MELELNPFQLRFPEGQSIQSLEIVSNLDWLDVPEEPITGQEAVLSISAKSDIDALKVFATGVGVGVPSMRSLVAGHIPNLEISQINGLQDAINSVVNSFVSANDTAISVTDNGSGGYTITPHFGATANTLAQGNDTRFSSNVTGLRKGAGAGSSDVAAVAKTDYWDTTVFGASGVSHSKGLVPDPGGSAGSTRYLNENGTWAAPAGSGTVTSVALTAPPWLSVSGSPVTTTGTLAVTAANQSANTALLGPISGGAAAPSFRVFNFNDVSVLVGTGASNLAVGNDTRFPASVTGLRKSSGVGSTDVAAVAGVDFASATPFGAKGPSHAAGLVPDPGTGTPPYTRYLREDSTWQVFTPDAASITNSMLAGMAAKTIHANATAGIASPTNVDAKTARSSSLLNLESITTFGNANYTALATDRHVSTSANFTATRTVTLPLANSFNAGQEITISDDFGAINGAFVLNISRQGADTIQGSSSALVMDVPKGGYVLSSDGASQWTVINRFPAVRRVSFNSNGTYTTPTGVKAIYVECIGGGGGGAGAQAALSNCSVGAGGGAGGYDFKLISNPASSYAMIVGSGGAGGIAANGTGSAGVTTDFGGIVMGGAGQGGTNLAGSGNTAVAAGGGGAGGGGSSSGTESPDGANSYRLSGTIGIPGIGGSSIYGGSKSQPFSQATGNPGYLYGGGGGGALSTSASGFAGGTGGQGVIFVTEYY